ncbi:MAG TPA: SCP2 sterol-binding domain-containing protein [Acidimicrobiales bacterium]|nr:SCP2 sterol-binding domain-containing protein [Acidimicrobiales bacterium]
MSRQVTATAARGAVRAEDTVAAFFARLHGSDQRARLGRLSGTYRFDVAGPSGTQHWYVAADAGTLQVSHRRDRADAVMSADRRVFEGMVAGTLRPWPAMLRNSVTVDGDLHLLIMFLRLLPGPPGGGAGPDRGLAAG